MSSSERLHWDNHYRQNRIGDTYPAPDPILFEYVPPLFQDRPHHALDLACGYAQNALWLASQGYVTDAIDISRVALSAAHARVVRLRLRNLNLIPADLDEIELQRSHYDVIVVVTFIKRGLMPDIRAAVRPGGRVIYQGYNTQYLHHDTNYDPEQLFRVGELLGYFADWRILHNSNRRGVSQMVAVKPDETPDDPDADSRS